MNKRKGMQLLLAAAVALSVACGGGAAPQTPQAGQGQVAPQAAQTADKPVRGGTLTAAIARDVTNLDPVRSQDTYSGIVLANVVDTLFEVDKDGNVVGRLVEKSENPEPSVYIWTLRKGIKFHDGTDLNAEAVKFNLQRHIADEKSVRRQDVKDIVSVETLDAFTVRVTLKTAFAPFLNKLTYGAGYILSPTAVEKLGEALQRDLTGAGSGAFKFTQWQKDTQVELTRNASYWKKDADGSQLPYLDKLVLKPFPDESVRLVNLKTGEADVLIGNPSYKDMLDLKADPNLSVSEIPGLGITVLSLNTEQAPFNQPAVRRAVSYAIDREQIRKTIFGGNGRVLDSHFPETSWANDKANHPYMKRDVTKAKQELASVGLSTGVRFTLQMSSGSPESQMTAELIKDQLKEAGMEMDIQLLEFAAIIANGNSGAYQALSLGLTGDVDPEGNVYSSTYTRAGQNLSKYSNPRLDKILDDARATPDQNKRAALYKQAQAILIEDQPYVVYWNPPQITTVRKQVQNYPQTYNGFGGVRDLDRVWKSK